MVLLAKYPFIGSRVTLSSKVLVRVPKDREGTFLSYETRSRDCLAYAF